ncbi:MAG: hypothetical protein COB04_13605 [Gammaproteobacteria bacterium]|nr:MAG: hypothetical protein COB04_13605 [Gammaproteobacteria bacterium]
MKTTDRLLICDDDKIDRMAVMRELRNNDFEFVECSHAKQAFEHLKKDHFDCILLDLNMPDTSGLAALKLITKEHLTSAPIIMLSGQEDEAAATECLQFGAQDYILKSSLQKDALLRSIRHACERKRLEEQLQTALAEAKSANAAKSDFFANMSHELRTPLNSIIGFTHRILKATRDTLQEKHYVALQIAHKNAQNLLEMINMILDLSKIEAGKMQLELCTIDLRGPIKGLQATLDPIAEQNNTQIKLLLTDHPIAAEVDPLKMTQIASNLLSNAIKFTPDGIVTLKLFLTTLEDQQEAFCIEVSDTGIGIKEEDQHHLFQHFTQVQQNYTKIGQGTGLGLAIVKEYTQLHGGTVSFFSTFGKGSVFKVIIPTKVSEQKSEA